MNRPDLTRAPRALCAAAVLAGAALAGCVPLAVVGGAVGAGTLLASADRRSSETQDADRRIDAAAQESVVKAMAGRGHVNVASYYRKVLITGEVPTAQDRQMVETLVRAVPGVQGVVNELAVMPDSSTWQRSSDALTTSKVRARLVNQNGVPSGSIRVLTERGTTYLMGRLSASETALATEVARQTDGVQRVVRVIDLIAEPAGAAAPPPRVGTLPQGAPAAAPLPGEVENNGVVTQPVTQPMIEPARPAVQVQDLPPMK